jgi:pyruvate decarboxylase
MTSVGSHLASRLTLAGVRTFFGVPGDFNLVLLDHLLANPALRMIGCCNELNAGYAADGDARATGGLSVVVVTYTVGGLSVLNAVAGANSEDLPLLVISGGPNTHDVSEHHRVHHTIGELDLDQGARCFRPVVAKTIVVRHLAEAAALIDDAVVTALTRRKPVYLEIACNLAAALLTAPQPLTFPPRGLVSDEASLNAAVDCVAARIDGAVRPVLIAGAKLRSGEATLAFRRLADRLGCAVAVMPDAKGLFPESHPGFIGTFWGEVSTPGCAPIIESSDCQIFAGPVFNDYTTTGWSTLSPSEKCIVAGPDDVLCDGAVFTRLRLRDVLDRLAERVKPNATSLTSHHLKQIAVVPLEPAPTDAPLVLSEMRRQIQQVITGDTGLVVETGDAWFNGQKLRLPDGGRYFVQMQYGSIGWSVGAALGIALAGGNRRHTVALIGDGSFQMSAQEVSTMIRCGVTATIFLLNNRGYTIEVEIHDGPYNRIKNWDYAGLMNIFNAGDGNGLGLRAATGRELAVAIARAAAHDGVTLIECCLDRDDCTAELLAWGSRVAAANGRS